MLKVIVFGDDLRQRKISVYTDYSSITNHLTWSSIWSFLVATANAFLLSYSSGFRNIENALKPNQNTQSSRFVFSTPVGRAARILGRYFSGPLRMDPLTFHKCVKQVFHYWTTVFHNSAACGPSAMLLRVKIVVGCSFLDKNPCEQLWKEWANP